MEELRYPEMPEDKNLDWRVRQLANGNLRYEIRVKGDTPEECKELLIKSKKELDAICR